MTHMGSYGLTKVTELHEAVFVDKDVAWLDVTVDNLPFNELWLNG